ncbi:hypothetical protein BpHYR1_000468 [Brachionus plicatilis]|uniref:Uncharacterized protein n=1 Tax=Brachionus plicatilis TaxID=10195 RepID=A0A3M7RMM6_BRAPC|nr:hypothetical protein BpHYR1_000468 [Brachionus plicatilis]
MFYKFIKIENLVDKLSKCEAVKAHLEAEVLIKNEKLNGSNELKALPDLEPLNQSSNLESKIHRSEKKRYEDEIKTLKEKLDSPKDLKGSQVIASENTKSLEKLNEELQKRVSELESKNAGLRATELKLKSKVEDSSDRKKR